MLTSNSSPIYSDLEPKVNTSTLSLLVNLKFRVRFAFTLQRCWNPGTCTKVKLVRKHSLAFRRCVCFGRSEIMGWWETCWQIIWPSVSPPPHSLPKSVVPLIIRGRQPYKSAAHCLIYPRWPAHTADILFRALRLVIGGCHTMQTLTRGHSGASQPPRQYQTTQSSALRCENVTPGMERKATSRSSVKVINSRVSMQLNERLSRLLRRGGQSKWWILRFCKQPAD